MKSKYKNLDNKDKRLLRRYCINMIRSSIGDYFNGKKVSTYSNEIIFEKYKEIYGKEAIDEYLRYSIKRVDIKQKTGFVYFIINDKNKLCKIGFSLDPQKRLSSIQTGCPFPLRLYRQIDGTYSLEKQLQKRFQQYKSNGEWFFIKDRLFDYLKELA